DIFANEIGAVHDFGLPRLGFGRVIFALDGARFGDGLFLVVHGAVEVLNGLAQGFGDILGQREEAGDFAELIASFLFVAGGGEKLPGLEFGDGSVHGRVKAAVFGLLDALLGTLGGRAVGDFVAD